MKQTLAICKAELSRLFYSPIAWLTLVIFGFHIYRTFTSGLASLAGELELYGGVSNVTYGLFSHYRGIYKAIKDNLYMFIPLLTMGLMSRDLGSGAIKLLYSSPVSSSQIILGKYLSMVVFSVVMLGLTLPAIVFTGTHVENADSALIFSGLAGQFLLFWAYSAIGLFMSCLTSYQIVAAILTLGTLGFLNRLSGIGQTIDFVRDITYWAALSGRTEQLTEGLVSSEDIIYFVIVTFLFISYSIYLLQHRRNPRRWRTVAKYIGTTLAVLAVGYVTSRPRFILYHDASQVDANTLTENSIRAIRAIPGRLDITTYVNLADYDCWAGAPVTVNDDKARYRKYLRFKPDIRMRYAYYYDEAYHNPDYGMSQTGTKEMAMTFAKGFGIRWKNVLPPEEIRKEVDLSCEQNHIVKRIVTSDGKAAWLRIFDDISRFPEEQEITAALNRLVDKIPTVAFLSGHGERDIFKADDSEYNGFSASADTRSSLVNTGFDVKKVSADTSFTADILVIADPRKELTQNEKDSIISYLDKGGNMVLAFEPQRDSLVADLLSYLGIRTLPGTLVCPERSTAPTLIPSVATDYAQTVSEWFFPGMTVAMPGTAAIDYDLTSEWDAVPVLATPGTVCRNERNITLKAGEFGKAHSTAIALSRHIGGKEQRVMIIGDADCLSNIEMNIRRKTLKSFNSMFCTGIFNWMSYNRLPADTSRKEPVDNSIVLTSESAHNWTIILKWILQAILALTGTCIIARRLKR